MILCQRNTSSYRPFLSFCVVLLVLSSCEGSMPASLSSRLSRRQATALRSGSIFLRKASSFRTPATLTGESPPDLSKQMSVLHQAAETRDVPPDEVLDAIYTIERTIPGSRRRIENHKLDGSWQLVFTTGNVVVCEVMVFNRDIKTQKKAGRQFSYIPFKAVQTFDPKTEPCHITNAVYWDETPIVQFSGAYKWLPNRSSLKWKFYDVKFFGWSPPIPEGWRSSFGLSDRAELPGNQIGGPFFNFLAVDDRVAVARATGVAIWKKVEKVSTPFDEPAGY